MSSKPVVRSRWPWLALTGMLGGFFSGLFGVGGGIVLVPMLILVLRYGQKRASGTSLAAILPSSIAGTIAYAATGSVDWIAGALLAGGAVAGSLVGTWLLHRIRQLLLRWLFIVFLIAMAVRLFFYIPERGAAIELDVVAVVGLIGAGIIVGVLSGLLGIGGGVVVVPVLMLGFGADDIIAKGTSLLMMVPTAITGTVMNAVRGNADVRAAAVIGAVAVPAAVGGAMLAMVIPPLLGSILFAILIVVSAVQLAWNALRRRS